MPCGNFAGLKRACVTGPETGLSAPVAGILSSCALRRSLPSAADVTELRLELRPGLMKFSQDELQEQRGAA